MNEPEQYQSPQSPSDAQAVDAAPVNSSERSDTPTKQEQPPQYGQYKPLEYGAMGSQFPKDYDPYLFGHPEPEKPSAPAPQMQATGMNQMPVGGQSNPTQLNPQQRQPNQPPMQRGGTAIPPHNQQSSGKYPRYMNGIDLEDPNQNINYGHWDWGAIIAFVFALFLPVPLLPAILGALSMRRTKVLRMKGYGLAVAAVIINILYTIAFIWLTINGISVNDVTNRMLESLTDATQSSSSGNSINA